MQTLPISERPPPKEGPGAGDGAFLRQIRGPHRALLVALLLVAVGFAAQGVAQVLGDPAGSAFARAHAAAWPPAVEGAESFAASPALGALVGVLAGLPLGLAAVLWALVSLAAFGWSLRTCALLAAGPPGRAVAWLTWLPAALLGWPLATALREGAPEPLVILIALLGVRAASRMAVATAGWWLALAAALQPGSALLLVHQLARGEGRGVLRASIVAALLVSLGVWSVGAAVAWERMGLAWGKLGSAEVFLGAGLVALALAAARARAVARGSAAWVRQCALMFCAWAAWVPASGDARWLWLLFPLAAVAHTALDGGAERAWRVVASLALAVAGAALAVGPAMPHGAPAAALVVFAALAGEVASQGTRWSRYQPGRT